MSKQIPQEQKATRNSVNPYAASLAYSGVKFGFGKAHVDHFLSSVNKPDYAQGTRELDRINIRKKLFGIDSPDVRKQEEAKLKEVNELIAQTQQRQVEYVLNELWERSGKDPDNTVKYLIRDIHFDSNVSSKADFQWNKESFLFFAKELSKISYTVVNRFADDNGKPLQTPVTEYYDEKGNPVTPSEQKYIADDGSVIANPFTPIFNKEGEHIGTEVTPHSVKSYFDVIGPDGKKNSYVIIEARDAQGKPIESGTRETAKYPDGRLGPDGKVQTFLKSTTSHPQIVDDKDRDFAYVPEETLNDLIIKSSLISSIGETEKKQFDVLRYNRTNERTFERKHYEQELTDAVFEKTGYSREEVFQAFCGCFTTDPDVSDETTVDYDKLRQARNKFIAEKLNELPEAERTEEAFVRECEKADTALCSYIFPRFGVVPDQERAFGIDQRTEMFDFAVELIPPTVVAKDVETQFNNYITNADQSKSEFFGKAMSYIQHLDNLHAHRSRWTRFVDYFRRGGEDSTIKRMKSQLTRLGFKKDAVNAKMEEESEQYGTRSTSVCKRATALLSVGVSNKYVDATSVPLMEAAEKELKVFDVRYDDNKAFKEQQLSQTFQQKETDANKDLARETAPKLEHTKETEKTETLEKNH